MKKLLSLILASSMTLSAAALPALASDEITVLVDGKQSEFDVQPIIENDRTLVPMRAIFEAMNKKVTWVEVTRSAWAEDKKTLVYFWADGESRYISKRDIIEQNGTRHLENERDIEIDVPARIVGDRTLVPLRAISEAFDCDVQWDGETKTVTITNPETAAENSELSFEQKLLSRMPDDKNYMVSPFSLKMALAMAANGADGETKSEILDVLDIEDLDEYNAQSKELLETLAKNAEKENMPVFEVANSIWIKDDYNNGMFEGIKFNGDFEELIADSFQGTSDVVNETNKLEKINGWVKGKTHDKIDSIIEPDSDFLASLINAVYMKAEWANQFYEGGTYKEPFADRNGKKTDIDFMHQTAYYNYYSDETTQMVEIPYKGGLSMYVVLGDSSRFYDLKQKMRSLRVALSIPKFKVESTFDDMDDIVKDMGVNLAFNQQKAQFPKMLTPTPEYLWIDDIIQKTYIDVDEKGTEAAAVTAIMMAGSGMVPDEPIEFKADKPFTYFICDNNGNTYFMGEYAYAE